LRIGSRLRFAPLELLPLVLVLGLVWIGSSIPPRGFPPGRIWDFDKLLHFGEYTVVGLALAFALRRSDLSRVRALFYIVGAGFLWAISDELHQAFVGRDCSFGDLLADLCGLLVAGWFGPRLPGFRWNRDEDNGVGPGIPSP
jgi:hypothetical protein